MNRRNPVIGHGQRTLILLFYLKVFFNKLYSFLFLSCTSQKMLIRSSKHPLEINVFLAFIFNEISKVAYFVGVSCKTCLLNLTPGY